MKKVLLTVFTTFVTVVIAAAVILGSLIAYDQYKEKKESIERRTARCEQNDEIFDEYLKLKAAEFAKDCFEDGYTIDVTFTYWDGMTKYRATWSNLNEDEFARFLESDEFNKREIERLEYDTYYEVYDSYR